MFLPILPTRPISRARYFQSTSGLSFNDRPSCLFCLECGDEAEAKSNEAGCFRYIAEAYAVIECVEVIGGFIFNYFCVRATYTGCPKNSAPI